MAGIRKRVTVKEETPTNFPVESPEQLIAAVEKIKQAATEDHGITSKQLQQCVESAAEKNEIKLAKKIRKKIIKKASPHPRHQSALSLCYRVAVVCSLAVTVFWLLFSYSPTVASFVLKHAQDKMYYLSRPIRMGIASIFPALSFFGLDFINCDCMLLNPFVSEDNYCPCLQFNRPTELVLTEKSPTIPEKFFQLPTYDVLVVRNAMDTANVTLEDFRDFKRNHPTHRGPKTCLKLTTTVEAGIQKMSDLYNPETLEEQLDSENAWAFTWEECPIETRPHTFSSLYPSPDYLPTDTELSNVTLYTLGTQYSQILFNQETFIGHSQLVVTLVLLGEVRFSIDQIHENCFSTCSSFKEQMFLKAGDVLLIDQTHWGFMAATWSKYALIVSIAVERKPSA